MGVWSSRGLWKLVIFNWLPWKLFLWLSWKLAYVWQKVNCSVQNRIPGSIRTCLFSGRFVYWRVFGVELVGGLPPGD